MRRAGTCSALLAASARLAGAGARSDFSGGAPNSPAFLTRATTPGLVPFGLIVRRAPDLQRLPISDTICRRIAP